MSCNADMPTPVYPLFANDKVCDAVREGSKSIAFHHFHVINLRKGHRNMPAEDINVSAKFQ